MTDPTDVVQRARQALEAWDRYAIWPSHLPTCKSCKENPNE